MFTEILTPLAGYIISTVKDIREGCAAWKIWTALGWQDLLSRYRRSWIGPIWLILTAAIFVGALGIVYGALFKIDLADYIPVIAVGFAVWTYISASSGDAVLVFVESETFIRQMRINYFVFVLRVFWRNTLLFLNGFFVALVVLILFGKISLVTLPLGLLGIAALLVQAIWLVPLLGVVGTRFRDLQPFVQSLLLVLFLITPIFWLPELLGPRRFIADFNPLTHLISIVRAPFMGQVPELHSYLIVAAFTAVGFLVSAIVYGRFKARIVYWL